ncbi:MAG: hypothetical protein AAF560_26800 [Acidobacteriota bacterium]
MSRIDPRLIEALRSTAKRMSSGTSYRWTHMGMCNCGQLAQTVTRHSKEELHRMALQQAGDWGQQAMEYCPDSGLPMDHVIGTMLELGLTREDLRNLEKLSDSRVLGRLPLGERYLDKRSRQDTVTYMRLWADLLEARWLEQQDVPASFEELGSDEAWAPVKVRV